MQQLLQEKRTKILKIASKHGAFNVRIFGSVARGEETENSDIDFLIDYDINKISPWFHGGLLMDLQDLLCCKLKRIKTFIDHLICRGERPFTLQLKLVPAQAGMRFSLKLIL